MSYTLVKTGITLLCLSAVAIGLAYASSVVAGGVGAVVFILGWINGVGDGILQW